MIFGKKQKNTPQDTQPEKKQTQAPTSDASVASPAEAMNMPIYDKSISLYNVLVKPRITEKATYLTGDNVYTFDVLPQANKKQVAQAVKELYNVTPVRVRIVNRKQQKVSGRRGQGGVRAGGKKAYVYLKEGDSIELI